MEGMLGLRAIPLEEALCEALVRLPAPQKRIDELERRIDERGLTFGDHRIPTFLRPHLVDGGSFDRWVGDTEALFALLERLAARLLQDRALSEWLGFGDRARELFAIDPGYRRFVMVARPDAIEHQGQVRFIEVNSDSPAMMTFADELEEILCELAPFDRLARGASRERRVERLLEGLTACYREWGGLGAPSIAIVDWPGEKTAHELKRTAVRFTQLGAETVVAAPKDLAYADGRLSARGKPIDFVYRRVLFRDFLTREAELAPLISAYRDGRVCMANPLRSYLVGTKSVLAMLHAKDNPGGLSAEERALVERVVPPTQYVGAPPPPAAERKRWVLKKTESHGGDDVVIGELTDEAAWNRAIAEAVRDERRWVQQRFEPITTLELPVVRDGRFAFERKFMNWNPFVFDGRHGGAIARVSDSALINISRGGGLLPSLRVR